MNRIDFMQQLESLLQNIAPMERDEAIQYYNDYFDDAGKENEQEVIEALGNPARVAENIKRDLLNNGYGEGTMRKALASDRALVEYEKEVQDEALETTESENPVYGNETAGSAAYENGAAGNATYGNRAAGSATYGNGAAENASYGNGTAGNASSNSGVYGNTMYSQPMGNTPSQNERKAGKKPMSGWAIALIAVLLVFASPVLLGVGTGIIGIAIGAVGTLLGVIAAWFAMIFAFGVACVAMFVVLVVLVVVGFLCLFTNPWVGIAMIGSGLVCGGIGLLFLMLTVAMAGIVTPAIFRGLGHLFRFLFKKSERSSERSLQRG